VDQAALALGGEEVPRCDARDAQTMYRWYTSFGRSGWLEDSREVRAWADCRLIRAEHKLLRVTFPSSLRAAFWRLPRGQTENRDEGDEHEDGAVHGDRRLLCDGLADLEEEDRWEALVLRRRTGRAFSGS
jgi:hypothetical protein